MNAEDEAAGSLAIFALLSPDIHPGPHEMTVRLASGLREAGYTPVDLTIVEDEDVQGLIRLFYAAARAKHSVIVLRHVPAAAPLVLLLGSLLRLRRQIFVLQVATPVSSVHLDANVRRRRFDRIFSQIIVATFHPLIFLAPHLILQYAPETGRMRAIGASKSLPMSHPAGPMRRRPGVRNSSTLRMVGVAGSARSPGFDRVLHGLARLEPVDRAATVKVVLIGHPEALESERALTTQLGLDDCVRFTGVLTGPDLDTELSTASIGIGTLAGHRVGLTEGSPLKHRAYLEHGLPFITSINDPGLPSAQWILLLDADDEPVDITSVLEWYGTLSPDEVRSEMECWVAANLSPRAVGNHVLEAIARTKAARRPRLVD